MTRTPRSLRRTLWAVVLGAGCSTLQAPMQQPECQTDADCPDPNTACDTENQLCVSTAGVAPRRVLGFDLTETAAGKAQLRVELAGCDQQVENSVEDSKILQVQRSLVSEGITLAVFSKKPVDPDHPTSDELLPAQITLTQPPRFDQNPPVTRTVDHPSTDDPMPPPLRIAWPRYDPDTTLPPRLGPKGFILYTIKPKADPVTGDQKAWVYKMLEPPQLDQTKKCAADLDCCDNCEPAQVAGECSQSAGFCRLPGNYVYTFQYEDGCNRVLGDKVITVDDQLQQTGPLGNASVTLRHADAKGDPPLGVYALAVPKPEERPSQCKTDKDCIDGQQFCDEPTGQCELALAGRSTGPNASTDPDKGQFTTQVFTYCQTDPAVPYFRTFQVTVNPVDEALPSVNFVSTPQFFPLSPLDPGTQLDPSKDLCIPDWGPARDLTITLHGKPVTIASDDTGTDVVCCDVDCIPATTDAAMMNEIPPSPGSCSARTSGGLIPTVTVKTALTLDPATKALWDDPKNSPCIPYVEADDGSIGSLSRDGSCPTGQDDCTVPNLAGTPDMPRTYDLRIVSPAGSVLRSLDTTIDIPRAGADPIELGRRVLVRGFVKLPMSLCDPAKEDDGDCGSEGAAVLAERLRMPGETVDNTPGPYFHEVDTGVHPLTGKQGYYVLPLDPGVWVLTALRASGTRGGPAALQIRDLRDETDRDIDFTLDPGVFVQMDARTFDRRTQALPLDTGSWVIQGLPHPARSKDNDPTNDLLDLNAIGECLVEPTADGQLQACKIRRLVPSNSLPLTQVGEVRFFARDVGNQGQICLP